MRILEMRGLLIALGAALLLWLIGIAALVATGRRSKARELAALIPNLLVLFKGLLKDDRVARSSKVWIAFAVLWLLSPIDLVPEFVPIAGPLDDAIVAALVLRHVVRRTSEGVLQDHGRGDPATLRMILMILRLQRDAALAAEPRVNDIDGDEASDEPV